MAPIVILLQQMMGTTVQHHPKVAIVEATLGYKVLSN
jgi:hypothetical protein